MLVYDLADPVELQGFVRNVPTPNFALLGQVLPAQVIDDIEYRFTRGDFEDMDVAPFRSFDAEAPIGTRPGVSRVAGELPPISKKLPLGEEQRLRLRQLQRGGGEVAGLADQIFADAARLARSVLGRLELAAGQSLDLGVLTLAENGVAATIDYGYTAGGANLVGQKPTVTTSWLDPAADVIGDLQKLVEAYALRNGGETPAYILTSRRVQTGLLRNSAIRVLAGSLAGAPGLVTLDTLGNVLAAFGLPPIRTYDLTVKVGGVNTRPIRDTQALLMPPDGTAGRTFMGVTAEALELVDARQIEAELAPGMIAVNDKEYDPVKTWTKVAAIALPTLADPTRVTSATVVV